MRMREGQKVRRNKNLASRSRVSPEQIHRSRRRPVPERFQSQPPFPPRRPVPERPTSRRPPSQQASWRKSGGGGRGDASPSRFFRWGHNIKCPPHVLGGRMKIDIIIFFLLRDIHFLGFFFFFFACQFFFLMWERYPYKF